MDRVGRDFARRRGAVRRIHKIAFAAALLAAPFLIAAAPAPAPSPLGLREAVAYALSHDPSLVSKRAQVAQAESNYVKLHAAEFPTVGGQLQSQLSRTENQPGSFAQYGVTPATEFSLNTAQVTSTYNLWNGGLAQLNAQQAKRQMESARLDLRHAEDQKAIDVATAYYGLANKRESIRLARGDVAFQRTLLDIAQANERFGRGAGVDVLRAQSSEARSQSNLVGAEADAANASESLAQSIGAALDTPFAIPSILPEPPLPATLLDTLVSIAQTHRPDIESVRAQLAVAILADRQIDTDRFPQLALNAALGNQFSPTNYGSQLTSIQQQNLSNAAAGLPLLPLPARGTPGFWQIGATATLAFPLIDWGTRHAAHRAARAQIDSATAAFDSAKRGVELDVRQSDRSAHAAVASLSYAKVAASAGEESARIAQLQYKNGLISIGDVASAQQQALASAIDLTSARSAYLTSLVRLRVSLGSYDPVTAVSVESGSR